jgi:hypothetical protein
MAVVVFVMLWPDIDFEAQRLKGLVSGWGCVLLGAVGLAAHETLRKLDAIGDELRNREGTQ